MSPITLVAAETYLTETRRTNTIATGVTSPPGPILIITLTTILTRYKHKRFLLIVTFLIQMLMQTVLNQIHILQKEYQLQQSQFLLEVHQQCS